MNMIKPYNGVLNAHKMDGNQKAAYEVWKGQRQRCSNPNSRRYKYYGARGIKVCYSSRDFISWYLDAIQSFDGTRPNVGRINHDKDYSFDNIKIESGSSNSKERQRRAGNPTPRRPVDIYYTDKMTLIAHAESVQAAGRFAGVTRNNVAQHCQGKHKQSRSGYTFRYAMEG